MATIDDVIALRRIAELLQFRGDTQTADELLEMAQRLQDSSDRVADWIYAGGH